MFVEFQVGFNDGFCRTMVNKNAIFRVYEGDGGIPCKVHLTDGRILEVWHNYKKVMEIINGVEVAAGALPEYEAHVDLVAGESRYSLSFKTNADRAAFLKAAKRSGG